MVAVSSYSVYPVSCLSVSCKVALNPSCTSSVECWHTLHSMCHCINLRHPVHHTVFLPKAKLTFSRDAAAPAHAHAPKKGCNLWHAVCVKTIFPVNLCNRGDRSFSGRRIVFASTILLSWLRISFATTNFYGDDRLSSERILS